MGGSAPPDGGGGRWSGCAKALGFFWQRAEAAGSGSDEFVQQTGKDDPLREGLIPTPAFWVR